VGRLKISGEAVGKWKVVGKWRAGMQEGRLQGSVEPSGKWGT